MPLEIERKFLIDDIATLSLLWDSEGSYMEQSYLSEDPITRVRLVQKYGVATR